jgi:hypothetical protein
MAIFGLTGEGAAVDTIVYTTSKTENLLTFCDSWETARTLVGFAKCRGLSVRLPPSRMLQQSVEIFCCHVTHALPLQVPS